jgi:mRNA interferase MazF
VVALKRGDIAIAALAGDYGKPRPVLVVQNDVLSGVVDSVVICPFSTSVGSTIIARLRIEPSPENGLEHPSILMIEKLTVLHVSRISRVIGRLDQENMNRVNLSVAFVLGLT